MTSVGHMPTDDSAKTAYDDWHDDAGEHFSAEMDLAAPWHQAALPHLAALVPGRDVLEVACGRGAMAQYLVGLKARSVTAADFSESAVRQAAELLAGTVATAAVEDIQHLSFPAASFDTVVSFETIEHVPSPTQAVRELSRVLRPGGNLILTTPNYMNLVGLFRIYKRLKGERYQEAGQPLNKLVLLPLTVAWVRRAGLVVDAWKTSGQYVPRPGTPSNRVDFLDHLGALSRVTGLHSMVVAHKAS